MIDFIVQNIANIIICLILAAVLIGISVHLIRNKRNGKTSCGCGCSDCSMNGICHGKK